MTDLSSLIERIEKSEGADRRLDGDIAAALSLNPEWASKRYERQPELFGDGGAGLRARTWLAPKLTASMDAVRTLIDPADEWELTTLYGVARAAVGLNRDHQTAWPGYGEHKGGDPVRALLSAALKARNPSLNILPQQSPRDLQGQ